MNDKTKAAMAATAALEEQKKLEQAAPAAPVEPLPEPGKPLPHLMCKLGADYPGIMVGRMLLLILPSDNDDFIAISPDLGSMENVERFIRAAHKQIFEQQQALLRAVPPSSAKN